MKRATAAVVELSSSLCIVAVFASRIVSPEAFTGFNEVMALSSGSFVLLFLTYTYEEDGGIAVFPIAFAAAVSALQWIYTVMDFGDLFQWVYYLILMLYLWAYFILTGNRRLSQLQKFVKYFSVLNHIEDMYRAAVCSLILSVIIFSLVSESWICPVLSLVIYLLLCVRAWTRNGLFPAIRLSKSLEAAIAGRSKRYLSQKGEIVDQALYDRCCKVMTEKRPFLVESFSLTDLAATLYTNKMYLSKTINYFANKNFRQFVNYYRVQYSIELFKQNMHIKIQDMSELSGFHSTVSFNMAFKSITGETPSEWRSRQRKTRKQNPKQQE